MDLYETLREIARRTDAGEDSDSPGIRKLIINVLAYAIAEGYRPFVLVGEDSRPGDRKLSVGLSLDKRVDVFIETGRMV